MYLYIIRTESLLFIVIHQLSSSSTVMGIIFASLRCRPLLAVFYLLWMLNQSSRTKYLQKLCDIDNRVHIVSIKPYHTEILLSDSSMLLYKGMHVTTSLLNSNYFYLDGIQSSVVWFLQENNNRTTLWSTQWLGGATGSWAPLNSATVELFLI